MKQNDSAKKRNKVMHRLWYGVYILVLFIIVMEVALRIYNPFPQKIRGDRWEMATNVNYAFRNNFNRRLDNIIINKRNSIGFRGENPGDSINNFLSILTIGGSTTACTFLTEGKTWTDLLGNRLKGHFTPVWINNAGIDGHSSYGHLNFIYYYLSKLPFKPKIALFLVGANDVDRPDLADIDSSFHNNITYKAKKWLLTYSETVNFFENLKWVLFPSNIFSDKENWNFRNFQSVYLSKAYIDSALQKQSVILDAYKKRLNKIIALCEQYGIQPVFITQPTVFGDGTQQGGNPEIDFHFFGNNENGQLFWLKLQLYNKVTMQVANDNRIPCIDLAKSMPKDTSYYYDIVHYTNAGAKKVADIVFEGLTSYLEVGYPRLLKENNWKPLAP